jgi:hypothetical protein
MCHQREEIFWYFLFPAHLILPHFPVLKWGTPMFQTLSLLLSASHTDVDVYLLQSQIYFCETNDSTSITLMKSDITFITFCLLTETTSNSTTYVKFNVTLR